MGKIFCIGLNKTGTVSLHWAFKILGLKSMHHCVDNNIKEKILNNYKIQNYILKGLEDYDTYLDWDTSFYTVPIFKEFDKQCKGSKFILNTRDMNDWLNSREQHVLRNQKLKAENPKADVDWLEIDRDDWKLEYETHYSEAFRYFKGRTDFISMDVCAGDGWEILCDFLKLPVPNVEFPKLNGGFKKINRK